MLMLMLVLLLVLTLCLLCFNKMVTTAELRAVPVRGT